MSLEILRETAIGQKLAEAPVLAASLQKTPGLGLIDTRRLEFNSKTGAEVRPSLTKLLGTNGFTQVQAYDAEKAKLATAKPSTGNMGSGGSHK